MAGAIPLLRGMKSRQRIISHPRKTQRRIGKDSTMSDCGLEDTATQDVAMVVEMRRLGRLFR